MKMKLFALTLAAIIIMMTVSMYTDAEAFAAEVNIAGVNRAVYISLKENAGINNAAIKARLQQDIHALEHVFEKMQARDILKNKYPILLIKNTFDSKNGIDGTSPVAKLSYTPSAAIKSVVYVDGPIAGLNRVEVLGRAYLIEANYELMTFGDLLALILLLPQLSEKTPTLNVSEDDLAQVKNTSEFTDSKNIRIEISPATPVTGAPEVRGLLPVWENGTLIYKALDQSGKILFELQTLDYYIAKPSWAPPAFRYIAGATENELIIVEIPSGNIHRINLTDLFSDEHIKNSESIEIAVSPQANEFYLTLDFNLTEEFFEKETHTFKYSFDTGHITAAENFYEKERDEDTEASEGAIFEAVETLPGHVSPVFKKRSLGWHTFSLNRHESYKNPGIEKLFPNDVQFAFHPVGMMYQIHFLAYGSKEKILLFDSLEQKYFRLSLSNLYPDDYKNIKRLSLALNPGNLDTRILVSVEYYQNGASTVIWDFLTGETEEIILTEDYKIREGWQAFSLGAPHFMLQEGAVLLSGQTAAHAIRRFWFFILSGVAISTAAWIAVLSITHLLPFIISYAALSFASTKIKLSGRHSGFIALANSALYLAIAFVAFGIVLPYESIVEQLVYPLPWVYETGSTAGFIFMWGFILVILLITTILFHIRTNRRIKSLLTINSEHQAENRHIVSNTHKRAKATVAMIGAILSIIIIAVNLAQERGFGFVYRRLDAVMLVSLAYIAVTFIYYAGIFFAVCFTKLIAKPLK